MPFLQQLLAQAVVVTLSLGGVACLCPADAVSPATAASQAEEYGHPG